MPTVSDNIVYWDEGVLLSGRWDKIKHVSRNNCFWNAAGEKVDFVGKSLDQWQAAGHEQGSIIADPKFKNPQQYDFHLPPDSPALKIGFNKGDGTALGDDGARKNGGGKKNDQACPRDIDAQ